jgi:hypothetical protein
MQRQRGKKPEPTRDFNSIFQSAESMEFYLLQKKEFNADSYMASREAVAGRHYLKAQTRVKMSGLRKTMRT